MDGAVCHVNGGVSDREESRKDVRGVRDGFDLGRQSVLPRIVDRPRVQDDLRRLPAKLRVRYSPNGVKGPGWHPIVVLVPAAKNATIRARQGYYSE